MASRSTSIPRVVGQRLLKAFSFTKRPRGQVEYDDQQIMPTATRGSAPKRLKEIDAEAEARQAGLVARWELPRTKKKSRGSPSYDSKYWRAPRGGLSRCSWKVPRARVGSMVNSDIGVYRRYRSIIS